MLTRHCVLASDHECACILVHLGYTMSISVLAAAEKVDPAIDVIPIYVCIAVR